MITNRMTAAWIREMADVEHEPEYSDLEQTVTLEVLPGLLRPQALDIEPGLRIKLLREFAHGSDRIHV